MQAIENKRLVGSVLGAKLNSFDSGLNIDHIPVTHLVRDSSGQNGSEYYGSF